MRQLPPAVILAAGESSRFWPLSTHGHKALHRLAGHAIIEHTVQSLVEAGIREIIIVQSPISRAAHFPQRTIADQLGDGERYGAELKYVDMAEPTGASDAILLCQEHLRQDFFVVNAEHINAGPIAKELLADRVGKVAVVAAHETDEPWLFGVFSVDGDTLVDLVEKPEPGTEPSRLCNMGLYLAGQQYLQRLRQEPAGDAVANLRVLVDLAKAETVSVRTSAEEFFPLKYPWHLFAMARYLQPTGNFIGPNVSMDDGITIESSIIEADSVIEGNVTIRNCLIGAGSQIRSSICDTIFGAAVRLDAGVRVREQTLDGGHVSVDVKGRSITTGLTSLGATIGHRTVIEGGADLAAGILIGAESRLQKNVVVKTNIGDRTAV